MSRIAHIDIFAALAAPFASDEVRTMSKGGRDFTYVTARTVMNRLDEVLGPADWSDDYEPLGNGDVICRLTITLPDGRKVTKVDVGGATEMKDDSDTEKTGFSDALKRAAVKFGVARYLYGDGVPPSIRQHLVDGRRAAREARGEPAALPAPVAGGAPDGPPAGPRRDRGDDREPAPGPPPKTGKALFAWIKERDEKHGLELLKTISDWGRDLGYPARMVQWAGEQVDHAHVEALRLITGMGAGPEVANAGGNRPPGPADRRGGR